MRVPLDNYSLQSDEQLLLESKKVSNLPMDSNWTRTFADLLGLDPTKAEVADFLQKAPSSYLERTGVEEAAFDRLQLMPLISQINDEGWKREQDPVPGVNIGGNPDPTSAHRLVFVPPHPEVPGTIRLKRYGRKSAELSELVHVLDSFGLAVVEDFPSLLPAASQDTEYLHLDDMTLRWTGQDKMPLEFDFFRDGQRLAEALAAVDDCMNEIDPLNRLVISSKLSCRQVALLRCYRQYRLQLSSDFPGEELDSSLFAYPDITRALVSYFETKFDPASRSRDAESHSARSLVVKLLASVSVYSHDQILRGYMELVDDTVRTNYYRAGDETDAISLKFSPSSEGSLLRHPLIELFVSSRDVIGIHLRAGKVARGGIRWSERAHDFRTEIYDLAQSQIKKNAIIVPTGAKGGFVVRTENPSPSQVKSAYAKFISSMLDLTDNVEKGNVVIPNNLVVHDDDDHYLVVAADKGTASFSDLANDISAEKGYWLNDAFASGGSHGYDHKALGITARGAWSSVQDHFRRLEIDINDPFRVIGVGDMSGDIFGNGMLQSDKIRLVAAFDHRHIFLDPDPDPEESFKERSRLFSMKGSSWSDYNPQLLSEGGGIWPRNAKEINLSSQIQELLSLKIESITPPRLIAAILSAPVELIWFGGIGTYIKDKDESDEEIGDSANDAVRITADKLRARVVVEGANLAVSQRARIRYARRGGQINTDFLDNAGGVAMSDYEVNLKILLDIAKEQLLFDGDERDSILSQASDEAVQRVLHQVEKGVTAIDRALLSSEKDLDAYEALVRDWEAKNGFDRESDSLPGREEVARRRSAGAGLTRPELAVLQAYAKSDLATALHDAKLATDPSLFELVKAYFPASVTAHFSEVISSHPLLATLSATLLANEIVDQMGIVWAHEMAKEHGCPLEKVAASFWVASKVIGADELWTSIEGSKDLLSHDEATKQHMSLVTTVDRLSRIYCDISDNLPLETLIDRDRNALFETLGWDKQFQIAARTASSQGSEDFSAGLAARIAEARKSPKILEIESVRRDCEARFDHVNAVFNRIDQVSHLSDIEKILSAIRPVSRWASWQLHGFEDDLRRWLHQAALSIVKSSNSGDSDTTLAEWAQRNQVVFDKVAEFAAATRQSENDATTLIWLAIRELGSTACAEEI